MTTRIAEIARRAEDVEHLLCDPECEGRCRDCPRNVMRDLLQALAASEARVKAAYNDGLEAGAKIAEEAEILTKDNSAYRGEEPIAVYKWRDGDHIAQAIRAAKKVTT